MPEAPWERYETTKERVIKAIASTMGSKDDDAIRAEVKAKFQQNPDLLNMLRTTSLKLLAEGTTDKTWGTGIHLHDTNALDRSRWHSNGWLSNMLMDI